MPVLELLETTDAATLEEFLANVTSTARATAPVVDKWDNQPHPGQLEQEEVTPAHAAAG